MLLFVVSAMPPTLDVVRAGHPTFSVIVPVVSTGQFGVIVVFGISVQPALPGTKKVIPLLFTPATVTTTFPVVAPKFVPPIVTDVPAPPDVGDRLVMLGPVLPTLDALNAAMFAIQPRPEGESVQVTATDPAVPCTSSSSAYPAALPRSTCFVKPLPAVNVSPLPAESSTPQPKIKSPFAVVVADPLERLVPLPVAPAVRSKAEEA